MSRIADLPIYAQRDGQIDGKLYNLWRRAKIHFTLPIRIIFPEHPGVVLIIEEREWVCADESQNDLPLLAWVDFEDQHRDALHTSVKCKLNFYHYAASKLRAPSLALMEATLDARLHDDNQ